jgi:hypothetical protein
MDVPASDMFKFGAQVYESSPFDRVHATSLMIMATGFAARRE